MNGEKVSIITISYNSEKTIEKTMQSVLNQKYRPLEYVLVDGNSKDETTNLIEKYIPIFKNAGIETKYKSEADRGISDAFNKGIKLSTGDIIGIINSDDQLAEEAIRNIAENCERNVDVICGDCLWIDSQHGLQYIRKSKMNLDRLKYDMVLMHPTCFVRKKSYEKYGMFDVNLRYVRDKDLMARFYRNNAIFYYIPKVISIMSSGGTSDLNTKKVIDEGITVAVRNGVPKWEAKVRGKYKELRLQIVSWLKNKIWLWNIVRKE